MASVDLLCLLFIGCPSTTAQQEVFILLIGILQAIENSVWQRVGAQEIFIESDIIFLKVEQSSFLRTHETGEVNTCSDIQQPNTIVFFLY